VALSRDHQRRLTSQRRRLKCQRRRRDAEEHRRETLAEIKRLHPDSVFPTSNCRDHSVDERRCRSHSAPRVAPDVAGRRRTSVHALCAWAASTIATPTRQYSLRNNEIFENGDHATYPGGFFGEPEAGRRTFTDGVGPRSSLTVTRNGIALAHATRVLEHSATMTLREVANDRPSPARLVVRPRQRQLSPLLTWRITTDTTNSDSPWLRPTTCGEEAVENSRRRPTGTATAWNARFALTAKANSKRATTCR